MSTVTVKIPIYELDDKESNAELTLQSHWNRNGANGLVVIKFGKKEIVVAAAALTFAAQRCTGLK